MGWATALIERLKNGETVQCRPVGNSMVPLIRSRQLCTLEPASAETVKKGDAVLCRVNGYEQLHLVWSVSGGRCLIGNNRGHANGWTKQVFGKLVKVEG